MGQFQTPHSASAARMLHRFDFDEPDNNETLPKFWDRFRPSGFPRFTSGAFDFETGRLAPPSFHLRSEGRNVAYQYVGASDTAVRVNSEYRIEGHVRSDRLIHARAFISAHFLDGKRNTIAGSPVRSRYIGGPDDGEGWIKVELFLPAAPPDAESIGLIVGVLQRPVWDTSARPKHHVVRNDISGGAWFDDITVHALPRVELTTSAVGQVFVHGRDRALMVTLAHAGATTLTGIVTITAADGSLVSTHRVAVAIGDVVAPTRIGLDHLPPGRYAARLDVLAGDNPVVTRSVAFVCAGPLYHADESVARPFGIVIDPHQRTDRHTELRLLQQQAVRSAKLPVWSGLPDETPTPATRRATDRFRHELVKSGFALTAVFAGPPAAILRNEGAYPRPLLEILAEEPTGWQEHLATVVASAASAFRWWQLGADDDATVVYDRRLGAALDRLREAMRPLVTAPPLAVPGMSVLEAPAERYDADQFTLTFGTELQPRWFKEQLDAYRALAYDSVTAYVKPLPDGRFDRLGRLADWARRLITARHAGADVVFSPQTWHVRRTPLGSVTEPSEDYLILRTIADVISDAQPAGSVNTNTSVKCLAFHDGEDSVLALWDRQAPPEGRPLAIQLGRASRQIDLWGRAMPLERDDQNRQIVIVSPIPVLVDGVDRWLMDLRMASTLTPRHLTFGTDTVQRIVEMTHRGTKPVSGTVELIAPDDWEIQPRRFPLSLMSQRMIQVPIMVRYPHSEPAGAKTITARINVSSGGARYFLEVPLRLDLRLADVEVNGVATIDGLDLILRHVLTNRSSEVLSFRGSASVPGRERQYRPITNVAPADTQIAEYRFVGGATLYGRKVRMALQEMSDGPRRHNLELVIP